MFFTRNPLSLVRVQVHISKKKKKENYQEELEERIISLIASLFGKKASQNIFMLNLLWLDSFSKYWNGYYLFFKKKKLLAKLTQTCLFCFSFLFTVCFLFVCIDWWWLIFSLGGISRGSRRERLLSKFLENECEKIDRLMELYMRYSIINDNYWQQRSLACTTTYISFALFGAGTLIEWRQSPNDWIV